MEFEETIQKLSRQSGRYSPEAYHFVFAGLKHTIKNLGQQRHVTGPEFLEGLRDLAADKFGRMARTVLEQWGVASTEDFGKIVFQLIDEGLMSKTEQDSLEDFCDVYDFREVFEKKFDFDEEFNL